MTSRVLSGLTCVMHLLLFCAGIANAQFPTPSLILRSGRGLGSVFVFAPDGHSAASAGSDGIQVVDLATRREISFFPLRPPGNIADLSFSHDGRWLASAGPGNIIHVWDLTANREERTLTRHRTNVASVAFSTDDHTLYSAGNNATVVEWAWPSGAVGRITSHKTDETVVNVQLSADGRLLAEASGLPYRSWWQRIRTQEPLLAFSQDGSWIVIESNALELRADKTERPVRIERAEILAVNAAGRAIVAVLEDTPKVQLWDLPSHRSQSRLIDNTPIPLGAAFSADGRMAAIPVSKGGDPQWQLWDVAAVRHLGDIVGPPVVQLGQVPLEPAAFSNDGRWLATADANGDVTISSTDDWHEVEHLRSRCSHTLRLRFSPRGNALAAFCNVEGHLELWDVERRVLLRELRHADGLVFEFTPDGTRIAWLGNELGAPLNLSNVTTGQVQTLHCVSGRFVFALDGARIFGEVEDPNMVRLGSCDARTGKEIFRIVEGGAFALSPDGSVFATPTRLYDAATGKELRVFSDWRGFVSSVTFGSDGRWFAEARDDGTIVIWDAKAWRQTVVLSGHNAAVTQVLFSPDGRSIVSASYDKTVRVWSLSLPAPDDRPR